MPSLLRTEAEARASLLSVGQVTVRLDLTLDATFSSCSTIRFHARDEGDTFADFAGVALRDATLDGVPLDVATWADGRVPLQVTAGAHELVLSGTMAYSSDGEGLHRHVDPADGRHYLYAMSFLDAAPRWFGCFDQPDLKYALALEVTTPEDNWIVRGNGPATRVDTRKWRLEQQRPLATYVTTVVAGPYASVTGEHDGIALEVLARQGLADELRAQAGDMLQVTGVCFDAYHELFGVRYPFGDYVQAFVPDFNAGAMENPGCVTFREQLVFRGNVTQAERAGRVGVIAHEMAHQWFGDLVTMRWWDDLWLNESFAEYLAHRVVSEHTEHDLWTDFGMVRKDWGSMADQSPTTHPVAANPAPDAASSLANFDGISYAKGAAVLKQLAALLGDEVFVAGLRAHITEHAFGNATMADLVSAWSAAGAGDLSAWVAAWLRTSGMDLLTVERSDDGARLVRRAPVADDPLRPHAMVVAGFDEQGREVARASVELREDAAAVGVEGFCVVPDADDQTWARVRFADGWRLPVVSSIESAATRTVVWNAVRDGVRHADLGPDEALGLVEAGVPGEPAVVIQVALLEFAEALAGVWSPMPLRAERRARVHRLARWVLDDARPGSDRHLAALRTVLRTSSDDAELASWLGGDGPELDADLRWLAVRTRVALGAPVAVIEDELRRDPSTAGRLAATRARAVVPTAAAKRAAFELLVAPSDASAYDLYATAEHLFVPGQTPLTGELALEWVDRIAATAQWRHGWALSRVASLSVPEAHASVALVERVRMAAARPGLDPALQRVLRDAVQRLERLVESHERFA